MSDDPTDVWGSEAIWATSLDAQAVLLLEGPQRIVYVNPSAERMISALGMDDASELLGLVPDIGWEVALKQGYWNDEIVSPRGGQVIDVNTYAGYHAGVQRCFLRVTDISDTSERVAELARRNQALTTTYGKLAQAQEQLANADKLASIGQLAAGVAHEINNPIGYVHSNLGTLKEYATALVQMIEGYRATLDSQMPPEMGARMEDLRERLDVEFIAGDLPKLLDESLEGIERVTKIVQSLKDFSYVERGAPKRPSSLEQGLESTLNIVWNDLKYKATIEKRYQPAMPMVECCLPEINQVLMNLLINAGQSIQERGTITLEIGAENEEAWVSVQDTGIGISENMLQRIFDPFYTTKPIGTGTGLGLSIAYSIITKHHGRIEVSSTPGQGSVFRVVLPINQPAAQSHGHTEKGTAAPP